MNTSSGTQQMIEQLVKATYGEHVSARQQHIFSEALHALVRLAKAEQMLEMRRDIGKSLPRKAAVASMAHGKGL